MRRSPVLLVIAVLSAGCGAAEPQGDPVAGARIVQDVADPPCGACHTLEAADLAGTAAPNLDELRPGYARVLRAIRSGPGAMPSYDDQFGDRELHDVAAYVSEAAGQ